MKLSHVALGTVALGLFVACGSDDEGDSGGSAGSAGTSSSAGSGGKSSGGSAGATSSGGSSAGSGGSSAGSGGTSSGGGGTSSGGGGTANAGGSGSVDPLCEDGCVATLEADCENGPTSQEQCVQNCEALGGGACATEYAALQDCSEGEEISCMGGFPWIAACATEQLAFVACLNN